MQAGRFKFEKMRCFILLFFPVLLAAQKSDFLMLQKNHRTIQQFYPGNYISFFTAEHMPVTAAIDSIKRDSLFLAQFSLVPSSRVLGGYDTIGKFNLLFSIKNIGSFPRNRRGISIFNNGSLLMLGGGTFLLLNVINTASQGDKVFGSDNMPYLTLGGAMLATGFIQRLIYRSRAEYKLGKKYQLKYLPVSVN